jgi:sulfur carrier protein
VIAVTINGEPREFEAVVSVGQLLERLGLAGRKIALECNGEIVPRSRFGEQALADGDRIEIVVAVGGG